MKRKSCIALIIAFSTLNCLVGLEGIVNFTSQVLAAADTPPALKCVWIGYAALVIAGLLGGTVALFAMFRQAAATAPPQSAQAA